METTFLGKYCRFAAAMCDAPLDFHSYMGYHVLGTCLGRKVWMDHGANGVFPIFWTLLVAKSSTYRKSTALGIASRIIRLVRPDYVYPSDWSREALYRIMESSPQGTLVEMEFIDFVARLNRKYNEGFMGTLTKLFDCPDTHEYHIIGDRQQKRKKGQPEEEQRRSSIIREPTMSVASATTSTWLLESMKEEQFAGGFLARFVFVPAFRKEKSYAFPPPYDRAAQAELLDEIMRIREWCASTLELKPSAEAKSHYTAWYHKVEAQAEKEVTFGPILVRLQTYALKFALLNAAMERSTEITEKHIRDGIHMAEYSWNQFAKLRDLDFVFSPYGKQRKKVLDLIRNSGKEGISHSAILRRTHLQGKDMDQVIDTLIQEETIVCALSKTPGAKKSTKTYRHIDEATEKLEKPKDGQP